MVARLVAAQAMFAKIIGECMIGETSRLHSKPPEPGCERNRREPIYILSSETAFTYSSVACASRS